MTTLLQFWQLIRLMIRLRDDEELILSRCPKEAGRDRSGWQWYIETKPALCSWCPDCDPGGPEIIKQDKLSLGTDTK